MKKLMKKLKMALAVLVMAAVAFANCAVAHAEEDELRVVHSGTMTVRELTEEELAELTASMSRDSVTSENAQLLTADSSYTAYLYSDGFDYYYNDEWLARADIECIVWHYTDGKVHLYQRTIRLTKNAPYDAVRTYGSIVNTDGSLSYTTGDRINIYRLALTLRFAIDFRVTPTEASFSSYQVN